MHVPWPSPSSAYALPKIGPVAVTFVKQSMTFPRPRRSLLRRSSFCPQPRVLFLTPRRCWKGKRQRRQWKLRRLRRRRRQKQQLRREQETKEARHQNRRRHSEKEAEKEKENLHGEESGASFGGNLPALEMEVASDGCCCLVTFSPRTEDYQQDDTSVACVSGALRQEGAAEKSLGVELMNLSDTAPTGNLCTVDATCS